MGKRDTDDVRDENHEAGFFPPNGHNPACPLPVMPAVSSRYSRRPLPVISTGPSLSYPPALLYHARRPPSVIPAVFSGNPVKTVLLQGSTRESYSFDEASMTSE